MSVFIDEAFRLVLPQGLAPWKANGALLAVKHSRRAPNVAISSSARRQAVSASANGCGSRLAAKGTQTTETTRGEAGGRGGNATPVTGSAIARRTRSMASKTA